MAFVLGAVRASTDGPGHEETMARVRLAEAGLARLDELAEDDAAPDAVIDQLRVETVDAEDEDPLDGIGPAGEGEEDWEEHGEERAPPTETLGRPRG